MRVIAVINQKGGCGKTTVSINLASALAELGHRTLLVDMDPQSHCAVGLAVPEEQIEQSIYDVLISASRNEPIRLTEILWQISDKLELAPASIDLAAFEQQMADVTDRECALKNVLDGVGDEFDYIVVDCPPAVGLLTFSASRAATDAIVPVETGYFSLHGLSKQLETLKVLCGRCNHHINVRVLASMYDIRTKMAREILAELRSHFADKMFRTVVNFNTKLKEAASFGQPISEYDPASRGQADFRSLAEEIIASDANQQRRELVNSLAGRLETISAAADELRVSTRGEDIRPSSVEAPVEAANLPVKAVQTPQAEQPAPRGEDIRLGSVEAPVESTAKVNPNACLRQADVGAKLSDYYGVNQLNDAVAFVTLYPRAKSVQIAGDFNDWQPSKTNLEKVGDSGVWQTKLQLPAGRYRYRLVVDGQWQQDPYNKLTEANQFGGHNSVVEVK
jgi:chromosome partitioning protein